MIPNLQDIKLHNTHSRIDIRQTPFKASLQNGPQDILGTARAQPGQLMMSQARLSHKQRDTALGTPPNLQVAVILKHHLAPKAEGGLEIKIQAVADKSLNLLHVFCKTESNHPQHSVYHSPIARHYVTPNPEPRTTKPPNPDLSIIFYAYKHHPLITTT